MAAEDEATKDGLSPTMYDKLRSEATTPFRAVSVPSSDP